jgi:hypothetical protein
LRDRFREITAVTDRFCQERLNDEYRDLCRDMAVDLCQPGSPVNKGKAAAWAAGIVYAIGWVNFLTDPASEPHVTAEEIATGCGVSSATMHARNRELRHGFALDRLDPAWCLERNLDLTPFLQVAASLHQLGLLPAGIDFDPATGAIDLQFDPEDEEQLQQFLNQLAEAPGMLEEAAVDLFEENPFHEDVLGFRPLPQLPAPPKRQRGR